eukprot:6062458-Pleurochrysis_carterae.AAC.1
MSRNTTPCCRPTASRIGIVHDNIPHSEEKPGWKRFREEIREVVDTAYERHSDLEVLDLLSDEKMMSINVFGSGMVLGVVREVDCRFVVDVEC